VASVIACFFTAPLCSGFAELLGLTASLGFERTCGHGGLLGIFLIPAAILLALLSVLAIPFSLFYDWRKWKKNIEQK
jgi:hypothetical protein